MTDQENATVEVDEDVPEHDREADVVVDDVPEVVVEGRDYRVEGNDISGYVGVNPEYMTYANETDKPINTDQEKWDLGQLDHLEGNMDNENKADEAEKDGDAEESEQSEESTEEVKTPEVQPTHNPPSTVPGIITPTV